MLIAALDTSGTTASFAVADETDHERKPVVEANSIKLGRESSQLLPQLLTALQQAGQTLTDIGRWHVGMGPGSFTGIRVGAALVRGICAGTGAAVVGLPSSLALVRAGAHDDDQTVTALHDGRRGEVIVSRYQRRQQDWVALGEPEALPLPATADQTADRWVIVADDPVYDALPEAVRARTDALPQAGAVHLLAPWPDADEGLNPVYVRPPVFVPPRPTRNTTA